MQGLIVAGSGLVNYLGTHELCLRVGYLFLQFKNGHKFWQINPSQTSMNVEYLIYDCSRNKRHVNHPGMDACGSKIETNTSLI